MCKIKTVVAKMNAIVCKKKKQHINILAHVTHARKGIILLNNIRTSTYYVISTRVTYYGLAKLHCRDNKGSRLDRYASKIQYTFF